MSDVSVSSGRDESFDELADKLSEARIVAPRALPATTIRFHSTVTYDELPAGTRRRVTLVGPRDANASAGRISVFSPIGRALLGRKKGHVVDVPLPMGRQASVRVTDVVSPSLEMMDEPSYA
jgi:transcription elongation GreA/GreB family factor